VFNDAQGSDSEIKTGYITVTDAIMLVNDSGDFALVNDSGDLGIIN
jgi:PKD repeat protein